MASEQTNKQAKSAAKTNKPGLKPERQPRNRALGLQRQDIQPLLFELVAQPCFVVGGVDAFHDLPVRRCQPAAEFH